MKKLKKDIDNFFDKVHDEEIKLPQSTISIIAELPSKKIKKELKIMETKTQKKPLNRWKVFTALAMSFVLAGGIVTGSIFLFRNNTTAAQVFNSAIDKMSQQEYLDINNIDNQSAYVFEKGKMVSKYSDDGDTEQWLNKDGSIKKESGLYYKNSNADKTELSLGITEVLFNKEDKVVFNFTDKDNVITAKAKNITYLVTLENDTIKTIIPENEGLDHGMIFNNIKNDVYFAPGAVVSIFKNSNSDFFHEMVTNSLVELSNTKLGIETVNLVSSADEVTQTQQIIDAIERGTDILLIDAVNDWDAEVTNNLTDLAKNADIPVIFFNSYVSYESVTGSVPNESINDYDKSCFVGSNGATSGIKQGRMIAEFLLKAENINPDNSSKYAGSDGKTIKYAMVRGELDNITSIYRTLYSIKTAQEIIAQADYNWILVSSDGLNNPPSGWIDEISGMFGNTLSDADKAILSSGYIEGHWDNGSAMNNFMTAFGAGSITNLDQLGLIISNNDGMALGVLAALQMMGFNSGTGVSIPIFGVDGAPDAMAAIQNGYMTGTTYEDSKNIAEAIVVIMMELLAGNNFSELQLKPILPGIEYSFATDSNRLLLDYIFKLG